MNGQYEQSRQVTIGASAIASTQIKMLTLAGQIDDLTAAKVGDAHRQLIALLSDTNNNRQFLSAISLSSEATNLYQAISSFERALKPWLRVREELGFHVDDGKLGLLKSLAITIENKIEETGMVTLNSDFQNMIKTQQNYLLQPNEQNLKLFNRAMFSFVSISNSYAMLDLYEKEIEQFKVTFERVSQLSQELGAIDEQLLKSEEYAIQVIQDVSQKLVNLSQDYQHSALEKASRTQWSVLIACALLALLTIVIFITISSSLSRSLSETTAILKTISKGNLSNRLKTNDNTKDEFNQLAISINDTCENLGQLVAGVQKSSEALSDNAAGLNSGLDRVVHHQSEVLGQTQVLASATEEVSVTTQEVSNSLEFVAEISKSSNKAAEEGGQIIGAAIGSLEEVGRILSSAAGHIQQLEEASIKVDSVMDIINGIAEQTNLLALNAAIEAARAGDQGRGFAVVADEVRSLAVRTVDAVSEISGTIDTMKNESAEVIQYIGQSETSMQAGQEKGHEAMLALTRITEKSDEANHQTEVIFASIRELAVTSQSMADSMTQISSAMKELEDNNEQLREVAKTVDERSSHLNQECQHFTL